jgi:hypothetical protein
MTPRKPSDVRTFLHLIKAEPSLLPEAPASDAWRRIDHRTKDEIHPCFRCGQRACWAYIADTTLGPRWLDMCAPCGHWMVSGMPEAEFEEEMAREHAVMELLMDGL